MALRRPKLDPEAEKLISPAPIQPEAEIIASAEAAEEDTEAVLAELEDYQNTRRRWTSEKGDMFQEYERLRDKATELLVDGPRYFLDFGGVKMVAVRGQAEPIEIDPEILEYLPPKVVEKVAPRKIDNEAFKRAVARGDVPTKLFLQHSKVKQNKPFVRFIKADRDIDEE